jgi:OOP family OmpA-OmpF porin
MKATSIIGAGAVCFVVLAILAVVLAGGWIEDDLAARSLDDLKAAGQEWASIDMDGRDAILSGTAPDAEAASSAVEVVSNIWGMRRVQDETIRP